MNRYFFWAVIIIIIVRVFFIHYFTIVIITIEHVWSLYDLWTDTHSSSSVLNQLFMCICDIVEVRNGSGSKNI